MVITRLNVDGKPLAFKEEVIEKVDRAGDTMHGNLILMDGENVVPVTKFTLPDDFTEYECGIFCAPTMDYTRGIRTPQAYICVKQYESLEEFAAAINATDIKTEFNLPYNIFAYVEDNNLCICADVYEKWITLLPVCIGKIISEREASRITTVNYFGDVIPPYSPNTRACTQISDGVVVRTDYLSHIEIEKNGIITFSKNLKEDDPDAYSIGRYIKNNYAKLGIISLYPNQLTGPKGVSTSWFAADIYGPSGNTWIIRGTMSPKAGQFGEETQEVIQFGTYEEGRGNNLDVVVNGNSVNNHLIDANIHVTQANKEIWNNKQDALQHYTESTNSVVIGDTDTNATVTLKCGNTEVVLDEAALIKLNQLLSATFAYPENS